MHSCIYEGQVTHRRFAPVEHKFTYKLFMMYLDLAELPTVFDPFLCWSCRRPNLAWFRRAEHLGDPSRPLDECVRELVQERTRRTLTGPIRLLTHLRYFGFAMNPVSYYYCFSPCGQEVECVVAEVNNTPWGEQHCYVVEAPQAQHSPAAQERWSDKIFHVSPFMQMNMKYRWHLTRPGDDLSVNIQNYDLTKHSDQERVFDVSMHLRRRKINRRSMAGALLRYPIMTGQVFVAIYWQALRLWWKKVPFVPHPGGLATSELSSKNVQPSGTRS